MKAVKKIFILNLLLQALKKLETTFTLEQKNKLTQMGIPFSKRRARKITSEDYEKFDLLIGMDVENLYYMQKEWNRDPDDKVKLLSTFASRDKDIADPWYTGNFDQTYEDIVEGLTAMLKTL